MSIQCLMHSSVEMECTPSEQAGNLDALFKCDGMHHGGLDDNLSM